MSSRTLELFEKPPRRKRRVLMHVFEAGYIAGRGCVVRYRCTRCPHETDWVEERTVTEARAGKPCPKCNP